MAFERTASGRVVAAIEVPTEFLFAKLHGRRTTLYEGERLRELAAATDIPDLAYRIYPQANLADQFALELQIQDACVEELAFLSRYVAGPQRELYVALLNRYVVEDLKVLLRLFPQEGAEGERPDLIRLPEGMDLPVEELAGSANVEQFLGRIPVPALRQGALEALPLYQESGRKAFLEMGLDRGCWRQVGAALRGLADTDRQDCEAPVRCEFDSIRFTAALRASSVYGMTWEQFESLLPTGWGRLAPASMRRLFGSPRPEYVLQVLTSIAPGARRRLSGDAEADIMAMEESLWTETARLARRQFESKDSGFALLIGYFYLKQAEMRHLLSLTQMVRRGMGTEEILAYLER